MSVPVMAEGPEIVDPSDGAATAANPEEIPEIEEETPGTAELGSDETGAAADDAGDLEVAPDASQDTDRDDVDMEADAEIADTTGEEAADETAEADDDSAEAADETSDADDEAAEATDETSDADDEAAEAADESEDAAKAEEEAAVTEEEEPEEEADAGKEKQSGVTAKNEPAEEKEAGEKPATVDTVDSRADGIVLNLFDYHLAGGDRWANFAGLWPYGGINDVSNLKFYGHGADGNLSDNTNMYTGTFTARQGIVQPLLADGYPVMTEFGQQNLALLFAPESVDGQKTVYQDVNHLFQKDSQGNYYYDSDFNYAYYDPAQGNGGDFKVYDGTYQAYMTNPENAETEEMVNVGYYPFDDWDDTKNNLSPSDDLADQGLEGYNHQHGLTMACDYYIPKSGTIDGEDLIFHFSGDDDTWVFIDDVLVMDAGGLHRPVSGSINFTTGEVTVSDAVPLVPYNGEVPQPETLGTYNTINDIFAAQGRTFETGSVKHSLKFFYLERGGCYSNMSLVTNLWKVTTDREEELTQIRVMKEWDDEEDHSGDAVTVKLLAEGEPYLDAEGNEVTAELNAENDWTYEFSRLPRYSDTTGDTIKDIAYSVEEVHEDGYYPTYRAGGVLVNTRTYWVQVDPFDLEDGEVYRIVSNNWTASGDPAIGLRAADGTLAFRDVQVDDQEVTDREGNTYTRVLRNPAAASELFTATQAKGDDEQPLTDQDGNAAWTFANQGNAITLVGLPASYGHNYSYQLTNKTGWVQEDNYGWGANYENRLYVVNNGDGSARLRTYQLWGTWNGLQPDPLQYLLLNSNGTFGANGEYWYAGLYRFFKQVEEETEVPVAEDWTVVNSPAGSLTIQKTVTGPKVADHAFTFTVTLDDDTLSGTFGDLTFTGGVATVSLKDGESATAKDLPAGLTYEVAETPLTGYQTDAPTATGTIKAKETVEAAFENKVETVDITAQKVWQDEEDQDGLRPESIDLTLLANGEAVEDGNVTVQADDDGNWQHSFTNLPAFDAEGQRILYTVEETAVTDYDEPLVSGSMADGFTVKNVHTPSTVNLIVTKVWEDADDQDGLRTDSVTVMLLRDGEETELTAELSEENDWTHIFAGLDEFRDHGTPVEYSVAEVNVDGYTTTLGEPVKVGDTTHQIRITNTHDVAKTEIPVTKTWDDADDQDGIRPEFVFVQLLADGKDTGKALKLTAADGWTGSFKDLDVYKAGKAIDYTLAEAEVPGYEGAISGDAETGFTLTNTHTPGEINIPVEKVWDDADNQDSLRPESVTIRLFVGDKDTGKTLVLSEENDWKDSFNGLPLYEDGSAVAYRVEEDEVDGYDVSYSGTAALGFTVTNSYEPTTVDLTVKKVWDDKNNADGIRPQSITATLSNGTEVTLNADNGWTAVITGLPRFADGEEIAYTWTETSVPAGYELVSNTTEGNVTTLTNRHVPSEPLPPEKPDPEKPTPDKGPAPTGDSAHPLVWLVMLAVAATGLAGMFTLKRRQR